MFSIAILCYQICSSVNIVSFRFRLIFIIYYLSSISDLNSLKKYNLRHQSSMFEFITCITVFFFHRLLSHLEKVPSYFKIEACKEQFNSYIPVGQPPFLRTQ